MGKTLYAVVGWPSEIEEAMYDDKITERQKKRILDRLLNLKDEGQTVVRGFDAYEVGPGVCFELKHGRVDFDSVEVFGSKNNACVLETLCWLYEVLFLNHDADSFHQTNECKSPMDIKLIYNPRYSLCFYDDHQYTGEEGVVYHNIECLYNNLLKIVNSPDGVHMSYRNGKIKIPRTILDELYVRLTDDSTVKISSVKKKMIGLNV